jgi:hypothetical protein
MKHAMSLPIKDHAVPVHFTIAVESPVVLSLIRLYIAFCFFQVNSLQLDQRTPLLKLELSFSRNILFHKVHFADS